MANPKLRLKASRGRSSLMADSAMDLARRRRTGGVMADFDGSRLSLARRLRRLPRTILASKVGVSAAAITQFEKGDARPTNTAVAELSLALGVPVEFFRRGRPIERLSPAAAHFRSLGSTLAISRDQALAFAELALANVDLLEQYVDFPAAELPLHPVDDTPSPDVIADIALETRDGRGLGVVPIPHVVRLLESRGVIVLRLPPNLDHRLRHSPHHWIHFYRHTPGAA